MGRWPGFLILIAWLLLTGCRADAPATLPPTASPASPAASATQAFATETITVASATLANTPTAPAGTVEVLSSASETPFPSATLAEASATPTTEAQVFITATSDGYPAPPTSISTVDPYPGQVTQAPTRDPYPGQQVTPSPTLPLQNTPAFSPTPTLPGLPTPPPLQPTPTLIATSVISTPDITTTLVISAPQVATPFQEEQVPAAANVRQVTFSPTGMQIAVATSGGTYLYSAAQLELQRSIDPGVYAKQVAYLPNGDLLLTGGLNGDLIWWEIESGRYQNRLDKYRLGISGLAFDRAGSLLAAAGDDGVLKVWDTAGVLAGGFNMARLLHTQDDFDGRITALALNSANQMLAVGSYQQLQILDARTGGLLQELPGIQDWVTAVAFSPDGRLLVTADARYRLQIWQVADWSRTAIFVLQGIGKPQALAFRPDGQLLASGHTDGGVLLWNPVSAELLSYYQAHGRAVTTLSFNDSGGLLASGSMDGWVRLWQPGMLIP
ncbi:MAG: hypothetical protein JW862_08310 [Anaerolineales bacterium]|nr:hypothetical protein [Anaerolineales bacterium]